MANVAIQNRDSEGRFYPAGKMDAEQQAWQREFEESNKLAKLYIKICEKIGRPELVKHLDIKYFPESGNWRVGHEVSTFFAGFIVGADFGMKEDKEKIDVIVFSLYRETLTIRENISRFQDEVTSIRRAKGN